MQDIYLPYVRRFLSELEQDFPNEHLGVADKFLLARIVRERVKIFRKRGDYNICAHLVSDVKEELEKYGFRPNK